MSRVFGTVRRKALTTKRHNVGRVVLSEEEKHRYESMAESLDERHKRYEQHLSPLNQRR